MMAGKLIDGHYHLGRTAKTTRFENVEDLFAYREEAGLEAVCVHSIVQWETKNLLRNPLAILAKLTDSKRIYAFGGVIYPQPDRQSEPFDYAGQAKELISMGFDGIKIQNKPLYKGEWSLPYYHENFDDFFAWLEKEQIPVMFHVGDPKEFWDINRIPKQMYDFGWYYGEDLPSYESFYEETDRMLKKFPGLNMTIPHFYFLSDDLKRLRHFMDTYPNVKIDITPGGEMYFNFSICQDFAREFFLEYQDRILFGTDNYGGNEDSGSKEQRLLGIKKIQEMKAFLEQKESVFQGVRLRGLSLPESVLHRIYRDNFIRWAGKEPKPVRPLEAEQMVKGYRRLAEEREEGKDLLPDFDKVLEALEKRRGPRE
ncbi:MAG: amidohydrolase family protein [Hungatella sp.]|nr:amidohydrolase family protein [Hungatella sp.]